MVFNLKSNAETIDLDYQDRLFKGVISRMTDVSTKYGSATISPTDRIDLGLKMRKGNMIGTLLCRTCAP